MKAGLVNNVRIILPLLLALVLATGGLVGLAGSAQAAAKGTTYLVTLGSGSLQDSRASIQSADQGGAGSGAKSGSVSIKSTIKQILDAPGGEGVLRECLGDEAVDNPQLSMAFGMSLPTVAPMSGGLLTDEMVACVDEGLQALASGGGSANASSSDNEPMKIEGELTGSFQMVVDPKGKVVIPKKTFQVTQAMSGAAEGYTAEMTLKKDAKGKLGTGGDVAGVLSKKLKTAVKKKGPEGSLSLVLDINSITTDADGKVVNKMKTQTVLTTGTASITASGTKDSGLEGLTLSGTGTPLDLDAGTGTLVGIAGATGIKSSGSDPTDNMSLTTLVLQMKMLPPGTYDVKVIDESPSAALISVSNGEPFSQQGTGEGITFQMIIDSKTKSEKVKSTKAKEKAVYYPVALKKIKIPDTYFTLDGNKFKVTTKASNAKGKLYVSGGDVDVSQVMGEKKPKETIGDGTADAQNSLIVPIKLAVTVFGPHGKKMMAMKTVSTWTTGQSRIEVEKSKSGLEGMALAHDGPDGVLPNPLQGSPLVMEDGTGALVSTAAFMNIKIDPKAAPPPPASGGLTIDNTIEELNANPATRAAMLSVLGEEDWGKAVQLVGSMTFRAASKLSDKFGGDKINTIIDALAAAQAEEGGDAGPPPISLVGDADLLCGQMWSLQITPAK